MQLESSYNRSTENSQTIFLCSIKIKTTNIEKQKASISVTVPKYGEEEEKNEIEEFEKPLLLFPIEQVEYLSDIYQVLLSQVPNHMEKTYLARSWILSTF